jgi:UDP-glucuronate 4-epimerase
VRVFVTGTAGFIGYHLAARLLAGGHQVTGYDGVTDYYDPALKEARLKLLRLSRNFHEVRGRLEDKPLLETSVAEAAPEVIVHLAAQAGVRHSLDHPSGYVESNLVGTGNLLEAARATKPRHLLIASTSSVYGDGNSIFPFDEIAATDRPLSLYAATKKANEVMSHAYAHLFLIPTTCFRFFTVYGPWGRPDMALFRFVGQIERGEPIDLYGEGRMRRDFTYIDDLVEAVVRLIDRPPVADEPIEGFDVGDSLSPVAPWRVVNIAGGQPEELTALVAAAEAVLGKRAQKRLMPMQPGDVRETWASPDLLRALTGYVPATPLAEGVRRFVEWYRAYTGRG